MEKVEKRLTKFRSTLKNRRKLSLPVFINQFHQQWTTSSSSVDDRLIDGVDAELSMTNSLSNTSKSVSSFDVGKRSSTGVDKCKLERTLTFNDASQVERFQPQSRGGKLERNLSYCHRSCLYVPTNNGVKRELRRGVSLSYNSNGSPIRPDPSAKEYHTLPSDKRASSSYSARTIDKPFCSFNTLPKGRLSIYRTRKAALENDSNCLQAYRSSSVKATSQNNNQSYSCGNKRTSSPPNLSTTTTAKITTATASSSTTAKITAAAKIINGYSREESLNVTQGKVSSNSTRFLSQAMISKLVADSGDNNDLREPASDKLHDDCKIEKKLKDSVTPTSLKENNLRQVESLENVYEKWQKSERDFDNNRDGSFYLSASNAKSLPQIHRLSDYEDDLEPRCTPPKDHHHHKKESPHHQPPPGSRFHSNGGGGGGGKSPHGGAGNNKTRSFANCSGDVEFEHKDSRSKRIIIKKKKANLRRRHATREKDGRSKSLTQIDSLVDQSDDMLLLGNSQGGDGPRGGEEKTGSGGQAPPLQPNKLGVPDEQAGRKPPLSMESRISSGEFITLLVESGGKDSYEEVAFASRGFTLRDVLECRGLDISSLEAYQEGYRTPLPLHTDTSQLGGRYIYIKVRDDGKSPLRTKSTTQIPRKPSGGRFWGGVSSEEYCPLVDEKQNGTPLGGAQQEGPQKCAPKNNKSTNRWSLFQSNSKDSKMEDLVRQLDFYSRNGIPKDPHLLQSPEDGNEVKLEDGWRSVVSSSVALSEREEQRQSAIWELVETEATYINMLKVITDLFLSCLCNLQTEGILKEIDTKKLFNNIQEVYGASLHFWTHYLSPVLDETRKTREPLDSTILLEGFCKFEDIFEPYTQYCLEQTNCQIYCKENARENNYFKAYLAWCETQKECNRLKLVDILVQPMQRITRYSILLKAILRKTDDQHHKSCLNEMISHVDRFVTTVNTALRNRHEEERLREIGKRIDAYEAVDAKDDELSSAVRLHSDLNLLQPMPGCPPQIQRWLLYQGDFKLKDAHTSKADVHVFLFTDFLLVTKITQKKAEKLKIVRPPYRIDYLIVVELKDSSTIGLINVNEWGVAAAAFTLQSGDPKTLKGLLDALSAAKKQFQDAKHSRDRYIYEYEDEVPHHLPRSPRVGSSRASRVSSLAHSHSGSMDLNEASSYASPGAHHPPSVDLSDVRASSASSEDSFSSHQAEIQRSKSLEGQHSVTSKQERRLAFPKTPNTLSVTPPYTTGQSLPNLTSDTSNSLRVPTHKQLSPSSRGTSYPPPSPRTLRRCPPVPQSRNPPLIKTRHVTSVVGQTQDTLPEGEAFKFETDQDEIGRKRLSRIDRLDNRRYHTAGAIDDIKKQDSKDTSIHKRLSWNYGQGPTPPAPPPRDSEESTRFLSKHKNACKSVSCESVHSSSGVSSTSSLLRSEYEALENIDDNELEDEDSTVVDMSINDPGSLKVSPHISTTYICPNDSEVTLGVTTSQYITQPLEDQHVIEKVNKVKAVKIDVSETETRNSAPSSTAKSSSSSATTTESLLSSTSSSSVQITVNETNEQQQQQQQKQQQGGPQSHSSIPSSSPPSHQNNTPPLLKRSTSSFSSTSSTSSSSSSYSSTSSSYSAAAAAGERQHQTTTALPPPKNDTMREILLNDASVETSDV